MKAGLLAQSGKNQEARAFMDEASKIATTAELYGYCRKQLKQENVLETERTANYVLKHHKEHWQTQLSLAEMAKHKGDNARAKKYFQEVLKTAPKGWEQPIKSKIAILK